MSTHVYVLPNAEGTAFKVGVANDVATRMVQIGAQFDENRCASFEFQDRSTAFRVERKIHKVLAEHKVGVSYRSGNTEWFDYKLHPIALGFLSEFAEELGALKKETTPSKPIMRPVSPFVAKDPKTPALEQPARALGPYAARAAAAIQQARIELGRDVFSEVQVTANSKNRRHDIWNLVTECSWDEFIHIQPLFKYERGGAGVLGYGSGPIGLPVSAHTLTRGPIGHAVQVNRRPRDIGTSVVAVCKAARMGVGWARAKEEALRQRLEAQFEAQGPWKNYS